MVELKENEGIPKGIVMAMAILAGITVSNLYYNQPLLEMISDDLGISQVTANLMTVITQVGYAFGLLFIIPSGDMFSRRRIITICMMIAAVMALVIGLSDNIYLICAVSLLLGATSVIPQLFMPVAGQFSQPKDKAKNIGYVLSGLLTGILAARVVSGFIGEWLSWRAMYYIASALMVICCVVSLRIMPEMKRNFLGAYSQLMLSVWTIFRTHPRIRLNSLRGGLAFGSMLSIWSCMAFHIAGKPFCAGSDMVGILGLCGMAGAFAASGLGKYVPKYGIAKFSFFGASLQIIGWLIACIFGNGYLGLIVALITVDIGTQFQQLSNQTGCIAEIPEASNRANTIFMTLYFIGGSLGTFLSGLGWSMLGWNGVCIVGASFAMVSLAITSLVKTL
jgi:predicted MFS family arabinose efflux permease